MIPNHYPCLLLLCSHSYLVGALSWHPINPFQTCHPHPTNLHAAAGAALGNDETISNDAPLIMDAEADDAVIPLDETFSRNPYKKFLAPLLTMTQPSATKAAALDEALEANGGVWKSFLINKPVYSVSGSIPDIVRQLTRAEARGYLQNDLPEHFIDLFGNDSLTAVKDLQADDSYFKAKKVLVDALSTQNVLNGKLNGIYKELDQLAAHWDSVADEGSTTVFVKDVSDLTYKVIINSIFGEEVISKQDMDALKKCTTQIGKGFTAIPIKTPILRKLPFFRRYSRAMKARQVVRSLVKEKIALKRVQLEKRKVDTTFQPESSGILDDFITQMDSSDDEFSEERLINFCVDNTILSIIAGFDTSASVLTTIMLILHSDPDARDLVRKELSSFNIASMRKNQLEAFDSLPVFKSVFMEAYRHRPSVVNTFRKTTVPVVVGNVRIPANRSIRLSNVYGNFSEKLYDSPEKVCPLRFYKGKEVGTEAHVEPPPNVFGYGKHLCPGQYLAQIEIALAAKQFLTSYDYELVEGQDLRPDIVFNFPRGGLVMKLKRHNSSV